MPCDEEAVLGAAKGLPLLLAGPTASGKSSLALSLAKRDGRVIVNADALQIYGCWSQLTARPSARDLAHVPHYLYGHVAANAVYSVGDWLLDLQVLAAQIGWERMIITGGTGLYFTSLTSGLARIPPISEAVRQKAGVLAAAHGLGVFAKRLRAEDPRIAGQIDLNNPMRTQRAWEVLEETGRSLAQWQAETPPPILPAGAFHGVVLAPDVPWLNARIETRFGQMVAGGALEECRNRLAEGWDPAAPSSKAIGAAELIAHIKGQMPLEEAIARSVVLTRQYAKRQRSWFRSKMAGWEQIALP